MKTYGFLPRKHLALGISAVTAALTANLPAPALAQQAEEIVVTGSRIVRRDLSAPSPITTVGSESFDNSSTTSVESVLNQLPQFVPGDTQFTSSIQNSATSTPGAATLNLRGLGSNRNLVLIDGRRAQPANATLVVDVNTIPAAAIANVEVITGGASAVYGPDAMAGVVNFILKDNFEGAEFDLQTGQTMEGDGQEDRASLLLGMNAADDRGNIMLGLDWTRRGEAFQKDRDFYTDGWSDPNNASAGFIVPRAFFPTPGNEPTWTAVNEIFAGVPGYSPTPPDPESPPSSEIYFNEDGTPFLANSAGYNGPLNCWDLQECGPYAGMKQQSDGELTQHFTDSFLSTPLERHSFFIRGNYDITDTLGVFAQANYNHVEVTQRGGIPPAITVWQAPNVPRDGRALPDALNTLLDSRDDPAADWALFQVLDYNGPIEPVNTNDVWQLLVGLEGELMDGDWTWEAYASRGDTEIVAENFQMPSLQRYQQLVYGADFGNTSVNGPISFADSGRGYQLECSTGLPVFSDFEPSEDCMDSIDTRMINTSKLTQEIVEANLQGGLMELPAGEMRFAAGATYRENSFEFQPGNPVGQIRDNPIGVFASNGTGGKIDVTEFYGELLVPVIENLELELGYRYSDFSTAGGHDTWKALFTWEALEGVTFRGGFQRATRAPNVAELFTAPTQEVVPFPDQDPCSVTTLSAWGNVPSNPDRQQVQDLCVALIGNDTSGFNTNTYNASEPGIEATGPDGFTRQNPKFFPLEVALRQGNVDVGPETGDTFTLGAVITEPFGVENLSVTVDAYRIELSETIEPFLVSTVYNNCFNWDGASNPDYDVNNEWCQMIRRNPVTGDREEVDTPFDNLGVLETQGLDLTVAWSRDIGPGIFSVNTNINYLDQYEYQVAPGDIVIDAKGTLDRGGLFDWQALTNFSYSWNNANIGINWRHLDSIDSAAAAQNPNTAIQGPGAYDAFNLYSSYNWDNYTVRFGIDNLLDEDPEYTQFNPTGDTDTDITNGALYDTLGRRWYLGLKASF